jgi:hypothetical protein
VHQSATLQQQQQQVSRRSHFMPRNDYNQVCACNRRISIDNVAVMQKAAYLRQIPAVA